MISFEVPFLLFRVIDFEILRSKLWLDTEFELIPIDPKTTSESQTIEFEISSGPLSSAVSGRLSLSFEEGEGETLLNSYLSLHVIEGASVRLEDLHNPPSLKGSLDVEDLEDEIIRETWISLTDAVRSSIWRLESALLTSALDLIEELLWTPDFSHEHRFTLESAPEANYELTSHLMKWAHNQNLDSDGALYSLGHSYWWFTLKVVGRSTWSLQSVTRVLVSEFGFNPEECQMWLDFLAERCDLKLSIVQESGSYLTLKSHPQIMDIPREEGLLARLFLNVLFKDDDQLLKQVASDLNSI